MQVNFKYKNGAERMMARRHADILQKLGRGTYMARDMQAQKTAPSNEKAEKAEAKVSAKKRTQKKEAK